MASINVDDSDTSAFDINDADEMGRTLLHHAVAADWSGRCVELLLKRNADCTLTDRNGHTALHFAAVCGHDTIVKMISDKQLNVVEQTHKNLVSDPSSPLHYASYQGHSEVVSYLADVLLDLDIMDSEGRIPLQIASFQGHGDCVRSLLSQGASIMSKDDQKHQTALHMAACNGYAKVMQMLLDDAAVDSGHYDPENIQKLIDMQDNYGTTALMHSATNGHVPALDYLLDRGANPLIRDNNGCTALHRAAAVGHEDIVHCLLKHFSGPEDPEKERTEEDPASVYVGLENNVGRTSLHLAAIRGNIDMIETLLRSAASVNSVDNYGFTALHYACFEGHEGCVEAIVMHESFSTMVGSSFSPLHCAMYNDNEICADRLLDVFDDEVTKMMDDRGRTPLHIAAMKDHVECIQFLIDHGAEINPTDAKVKTPLMVAASSGQNNAVELLLNLKADAGLVDQDNNNSLHLACLNRKSDCALVIIDKTADSAIVNAQNNWGQTALHIAAKAGLLPVTQQLLSHDANTDIIDHQGMNPALSCAISPEVADCLEVIIMCMIDTPQRSNRESTGTWRTSLGSAHQSSYIGTIAEKSIQNHNEGEGEGHTEVNGEVENVDSDTYF